MGRDCGHNNKMMCLNILEVTQILLQVASFVVYTDGPFGKETKCLLKTLSILLSDKWEKPYAVVCGYVNAPMSIAIVRATHICLRGSRIPTSKMSNRHPQWEESLFRISS
jgi:hypothetical protein